MKVHPSVYKRYNNSCLGRLRNYKARCKRKGIVWALTDEQAVELFAMNCRYCGSDGHGIDRVDSLIGYIPGNVVPCCSVCNFMKSKSSAEGFMKHAAKITAHQASLQIFSRATV